MLGRLELGIYKYDGLVLGQFWPFLRNFQAFYSCFKDYQTAFWVCRMARGVQLLSQNTKTKFWYNTSQNIEPKWAKNCEKWNLDLSQFLAILRPFKGYQTAFVVCKMVRGVPMIPRNNPDNILVQYTSKYWAKMGQNLKK